MELGRRRQGDARPLSQASLARRPRHRRPDAPHQESGGPIGLSTNHIRQARYRRYRTLEQGSDSGIERHMAARIFRRYKNAMQSGRAREREWVLEFESEAPRRADPLLGGSGGTGHQSQAILNFDSFDAPQGQPSIHSND